MDFLSSVCRFSLLLSLSSCATLRPPPLVLTGQAAKVEVLGSAQASRVGGCVAIAPIAVTDGVVEPGKSPFEGTRERAIMKLQSQAAAFGADTVVIDETATQATIAIEGAKGQEVRMQANAYRCR